MNYPNVLNDSLQKKILTMPKDTEIMPLGNIEEKMEQLTSSLEKMANKKNKATEKLLNYQEERKNKEIGIKQLKEEIKELETKQNMFIIELEKDNKSLRFQNFQKQKNTNENIDNESIQNDIAKLCDEIQQLVGEIQAYGDYTIAITPEIEQKKQSIDLIKKENKELTKEIDMLLNKEKKNIMSMKKIIDQINAQEVESQSFLNSIEEKANFDLTEMKYECNGNYSKTSF